jgi:hypothetical protein
MRLRVKVLDGGLCVFAYADATGAFQRLPNAFQASPGVWIGAKVGLYSIHGDGGPTGYADVNYFRFLPLEGQQA